MKKAFNLILTLLFVFTHQIAYSQNTYYDVPGVRQQNYYTGQNDLVAFPVVTSNPEPYTFRNYSNEGSVDLATGKFGLNIPFYTIKNGFVNIPVGLHYSTSGVKVDKISSEIGLGWNLQGTASIVRELRGEPDEIYYSLGGNQGNYTGRAFPTHWGGPGVPAWFNSSYSQGVLNQSVRGSALDNMLNRSMLYFPNFPNNQDEPNEINWIMRMSGYQNGEPFKADLERDIFHVSVGDLKFSFALHLKTYSGPRSTTDVADLVEAVPLDEKGIKIDFIRGTAPYYMEWNSNNIRERTFNWNHIIKFVITDKKGVKYIFDKTVFAENEQINSFVVVANSHEEVGHYTNGSTHIAEWKLSSIEFPNNEKLLYHYTAAKQKTKHEIPRLHTGEFKGQLFNTQPAAYNDPNEIKYLYNTVDGWRLNSIEYITKNKQMSDVAKYSIRFKYSQTIRKDHEQGGDDLKYLFLINGGNNIDLGHDYEEHESLAHYFNLIKLTNFSTEEDFPNDSRAYRMYLSEIIDSKKTFSYKFTYNYPFNLPRGTSYMNSDFFGYPGRVNVTEENISAVWPYFTKLYYYGDGENKLHYYEPNTAGFKIAFAGYDRSPNPSNTHFGTLKKIDFPTKGYMEINYESNRFYNSNYIEKNALGPGVRIKSLNYYTENGLSHRKNYKYDQFADPTKSSGNLLYYPSYAYIVNSGFDNERKRPIYWANDINSFVTKKELERRNINNPADQLRKLVHFSTHPLGPTSDVNGAEIIYTNVQESNEVIDNNYSETGYTRYMFHFDNNNRTIVNTVSGPTDELTYITPGGVNTGYATLVPWQFNTRKVKYGYIEKRGYDIFPFPARSYYGFNGYLNGKLLQQETFDGNNTKLKGVYYRYNKHDWWELEDNNFINNIKMGYIRTHVHCDGAANWCAGMYANNDNHVYTETKVSGVYCFAQELIAYNNPINVYQVTETYYGVLENKQTFEHDFNKNLLSSISSVNSDGKQHVTTYKYPSNYDYIDANINDYQDYTSKAISLMNERNIIDKPVEILKTVNGKIIEGKLIQYRAINNDSHIAPYAIRTLETVEPITSSTFDFSSIYNNGLDYGFISDPRYSGNGEFFEYDNILNIKEAYSFENIHTSYLWGYNNAFPVAKVVNASHNEIFFNSFEENNDNWPGANATYDKTNSHNGQQSLKITSTSGERYSFSPFFEINNTVSKKYIYSGWVYVTGTSADVYFFMKPGINNDPYETGWQTSRQTTSTTGRWVFLKGEVNVPANMKKIYLRVDCNGAGTAWFDDIRLYPSDAQMTSYTYKPLVGVTSETDANDITTYYEYDLIGRLATVRDHVGNILKKYEYKYATQP